MKTAFAGQNRLLIKLEPGDEIVGSLEMACAEQGWQNATVDGIGSVENPLLAHYRLDQKKYTQKQMNGVYEVTAFQGNLAHCEGKLLAHVHVSIADFEMNAFGGHLVEGYCSATAELILTKLDSKYQKSLSPLIGLKTWDLPAN